MIINAYLRRGCLLFVLFAALAFSQAMDGNLVGTVTDASGAALPNTTLVLENLATGVRTTVQSGTDGAYRFGNALVGRYKLTAQATGFKGTQIGGLQVELNKASTVNIRLEVGEVTTVVEISEAVATIDTTTATVQNSYNLLAAQGIPLTGNSSLGVINLSMLSAGVSSSGGTGYGTGPSVGGQRPTNNNFMIEGVDNNNRSVTGPIVNISNEAVAEFSLQQNQFAPEFGHSTGGQFNTVIRSGTNALHGSAYEYFQNRKLNAIDESFKRQGISNRPRYDQNRFGGTVGGPVMKNKWFYFGNFEYNPLGQAATSGALLLAPTDAGITRVAGLPGASRQNLENYRRFVTAPTAQAVDAAGRPRSVSVLGETIPVGIVTLAAPSYQNTLNYLVSSDYNLSEKDMFRARYAYSRIKSVDTAANFAIFFQPYQVTSHLANYTWLHTFSPRLTTETRAGYNRRSDDRQIGGYQWAGTEVFPNVSFLDLGLTIGPNGNYPQSNRSNTIQLVNNTTWIKGRHTFKGGYDGRKLNITSFFVQRLRGDYVYNTFDRFVRDITPEFAQRSAGGFPFIGNLLSHYLYLNDEWRVKPNLTLTLGLRYEFIGVPEGAKSHQLNALASVPGLITYKSPEPTKKDFAPRIGIAWNPGGDGKMSIRAGFGVGYDQVYQNLGVNSLPPQFFTTIDGHIEQANQAGFLQNGGIRVAARPITDPAVARARTSSFIPDQLRPYSLQWNAGVQRVFRRDYTVEVRYLGSRGIHLPFQVQPNRPAGLTSPDRALPLFLQRPSQAQIDALTNQRSNLTTGFLRDPLHLAGFTSTITSFMPVGNSTYHGLATQVNKRFSNGLQFVGSYTWSSLIDDSTAALFSTVTTPRRPQDFFNLRNERSHSALDHRHRFTLGWYYELPWLRDSSNRLVKGVIGGWNFSGAYTAQTDSWASFRSAADSNLNGDNAGDRVVFNEAGSRAVGSGVTALCRSTLPAGATCGSAASNPFLVGYVANNSNAAWIQAPEGVWANAGRNVVRFPMINNFDMAAGKRFSINERASVEFRAEFYNAFNHAQFVPGFPSVANARSRTSAAATNGLLPQNPNFLRWNSIFESNARTGQLVLRFVF